MDGVYKSQRHIYDFTRKYYLLGRDQLIFDLKPDYGQTILEVGCGTGRNLIQAARLYPWAKFYGFDISEEMLITARKNIEKARLSDRIILVQGDASNFSCQDLFGIEKMDRVFYSYTLSMIPPWQDAIEQGLKALEKEGSLHIIDFGQQEDLPSFFKTILKQWLKAFHVVPRADLAIKTAEQAEKAGRRHSFKPLYKGYSWGLKAW